GQVGYDQGRSEQFYRQLAERIPTIPGVKSATLSTTLPLFGFVQRSVIIDGREHDPQSSPLLITANVIDPGYFDTAGIALLRGRDFTDADRSGSAPVAIVNE